MNQTPERSDAVPQKKLSTAAEVGFEPNVRQAVADLQRVGYKVELQEVHGHYRGQDGETYNQRGYAIRVYPWKDRS